MTNLLIRFAINAVSIYITSLVVPGLNVIAVKLTNVADCVWLIVDGTISWTP